MMRPAVVHLQKSSSSSSKKRPQYIVLDSVTETLPDAVHMNRRTAADTGKSMRRDNPTQQSHKTHARNDFYETSHLDMNAAANSKSSLAGSKFRHYSPLKSSSTNEMMMIAARQDVPMLELHANKKLDGEKRKEKMRVYKAKPINLSNKNYTK